MNEILRVIDESILRVEALKSIDPHLLAMEARLHKKMSKIFAGAANEVLDQLRSHSSLPTDPGQLSRALQPLKDAQASIAESIYGESVENLSHGGDVVINKVTRAGFDVKIKPGQWIDSVAREKIRTHAFEASKTTMDRLVGHVMDNIIDSYDQGLGIDDAARRLKQEFVGMRDHELIRVARTEVNSLQNEGAQQIIESLGIGYEQWWTSLDERVRDGSDGGADHVMMHGQIVRVGETFSNGLKHPGDRSGGQSTISEWINCRCRVVPFLMPEGMMAPPGKSFFYESDLLNF